MTLSLPKIFGCFAAVAALAAFVVPASAQVDEISVQGSSSTGGNAELISGRLGGEVRFSITGRFNDTAEVFLGNGTLAFGATVRELWNGTTGLEVVDRVQLPDGRSRVFLRIRNAQLPFSGGRVRLRSGNIQFDSDPVILFAS